MANTIAPSALRPDLSKIENGTDRQFAYVKYYLPKLNEDELTACLATLATMEADTAEYIALRNKIVEGKLEYAYAIASKYAHRFGTANADDCYQWASVGLIKAVEDYSKNGNGASFLPYAKTAICRAIQRHGITPLVKCGIKGGRNPLNRKHNKEVDEKRAEKGLAPIETVSVINAEQKDEDGKKANILEALPSEDASPLDKAMEAERDKAFETALNALSPLDKQIYNLRIINKMEWEDIGKQVGLKKSTAQMRFYASRDRLKEAMANADA